jgi:hypothetical protein
MSDLAPFQLGSLYGLLWVVVARLAVEMWRVSQRVRASRVVLMRLWRWRDC